jgi:uncharacterized membrane protein
VGTLVYVVGHMAGRINVDTVIELVGDEVRQAIARLTAETPGEQPPPVAAWHDAVPVRYARRGYLQQIDPEGLAGWAHRHGAAIRLLVPPARGYARPQTRHRH